MTDFRELGEASAIVRSARAAWRQRVHACPAILGDILAMKPPELEGVLLVDLVLWLPGFGEAKLRRLGQRAITGTRQVNLLVTLGSASERTRHWLASELRLMGDFYKPITMRLDPSVEVREDDPVGVLSPGQWRELDEMTEEAA